MEEFFNDTYWLWQKELHDIYRALQYTRLETGYNWSESEAELYETIKLYDILRDMDFELTDTQVEVFEKLQDAEVNGGFF